MIALIIIAIVVLIFFWVIGTFNGLVSLRNKVRDQWSQIDVLLKRSYKVAVVNSGKRVEVIRVPAPIIGKRVLNTIDVAFPIIHGTNGEDGTIAAFINLLGIPCVGPDILASSVGMD